MMNRYNINKVKIYNKKYDQRIFYFFSVFLILFLNNYSYIFLV